MRYLKVLFFFSYLGIVTSLYAQDKKDLQVKEIQRVSQFFRKNDHFKNTSDSSMLLTFAFKSEVSKNKNGSLSIALTANDSLAYTIYPKYDFLKSVNYQLFMKDKEKAIFIFPVALEIIGSKLNKHRTESDFLNKIMTLLSYKMDDFRMIDDYIYFQPFLLRINKIVVE